MKKISSLLAILMMLAIPSFFLTSCDPDDGQDKDLTPTLTFQGGAGFYSTDSEIALGSNFNVGVVCTKNAISKENLVKFTIEVVNENNKQVIVDTTFNSDNFTESWTVPALPKAGSYKLYFRITDKKGQYTEKSFTITVKGATSGEITTNTAKLLGAQNATAGSLYASINDMVYKQSEANANVSKIDISYGVIANQGSFISPSTRGNLGFAAITGGTRTTYAKTAITEVQFDAANTDALFLATTATATDVRTIAVGEVYFFQNANGKKGLIKITNLTAGEAGSVTIVVKVQK